MTKKEDLPINMIKINEKESQKYEKVKPGKEFQVGDLIHLVDDEYVRIQENNNLLKTKISNYSTVLRKKK
jgi:hypothetical protein